jgi:hypothetical protein
VGIKKPSDFFNKKNKKNIQLEQNSKYRESSNVNDFNIDVFESFKKVSENLDGYFLEKKNNSNDERLEYFNEKISRLERGLESSLKKEDLERAVMSQLLVVEDSIGNIQDSVREISEKSVSDVKLDIINLKKILNGFVKEEFPRYKKIICEYQNESDNKYDFLEDKINKTFSDINLLLDEKYNEITNKINILNEESFLEIVSEFKLLDETVLKFTENDIPRYKQFIIDYEQRTESKLDIFEEKIYNLSEKIEIIGERENNEIEKINEKISKKIEEVEDLKEIVFEGLNVNESYREKIDKKVSDLEI